MTAEDVTRIRFDQRDIHQLMEQIRGFEIPIVSIYASVHPGRPETAPQAVTVRAKNTVKHLDGVPVEVRERIIDYFEQRTATGRSVAVFANSEQLQALELDVPLLVGTLGDQLDARVGEPYFAPLLSALSENAPALVVFADRDHVCLYRVVLGQAESLFHVTRERTAKEMDEATPSKDRMPKAVVGVPAPAVRSPHTASNQQSGRKYVADRGDAAKQLFEEGIANSQAAFYRESAERIELFLQEHGVERVLVMGPERDRHLMFACLPPQVTSRVVGMLPSSDGQLPAPHQIVDLVHQTLVDREAEQGVRLLDTIAERGVWGVSKCLTALQEGRLRLLVVPKTQNGYAYCDPNTGYVSLEKEQVDALGVAPAEEVDLSVKLPQLAEQWGAELQFVSGDVEKRIFEEFDGMGGLVRW